MAGRMGFLSATHPPNDGLRCQQINVAVHIERENLGKGTLFIAESYVSWINGTGQGFTIPYPAISLHAVSRDLSSYPHECLYLMIDASIMSEILQIPSSKDSGGSGDNDDEEETEGEEDEAIRELRFIPDDKQALEKLFTVMSDCQTLHPDPDDSEPSDEDFGDEFDDADEDMGEEDAVEEDGSRDSEVTGQQGQGRGTGVAQNGHVDGSMIKTTSQSAGVSAQDDAMDTGQFADADMEPDH